MNEAPGGNRHIPKIHSMRLDSEPFLMIKNGLKTVELRLNDERRKDIEVGDFIHFVLRDSDSMILSRVRALYKAPSFAILFEVGGILKKCGWQSLTPCEAAQIMRKYYSETDESTYGALGIELDVIIKEPTETPFITL